MRTIFWAAIWVFLLDQISKYVVVHLLDLRTLGEIDVWPPFINLRMAWNSGINFGLFSGHTDLARLVLISIALGIVGVVIVWVWRDPPGRIGRISAGLLIGGALGNVVDRAIYGAVADFLNMSCCGLENPYAFNLADIAVFAGAFGLVLFSGNDAGHGSGNDKRPRKKGT
ncbi:signal peptidase II [Marinovum sp. 2_MG-2023]|uniref:signal peptidase II n=1 Tax=Roseobacteraceae TaxID=2854170 RepID=UPI001FD0E294|nr:MULTISPECIES: signal peptidase II [Roseobacteraceae]MCJ7872629.1 signal peptidase II [Phaeobacter sp. J2-8]MDO6730316.1 signal peptidase II [Marinovum sp. 2_MG-2023]MDO6779054.1 signal peptidase II [Marinovum sp. 1_MG-2023]